MERYSTVKSGRTGCHTALAIWLTMLSLAAPAYGLAQTVRDKVLEEVSVTADRGEMLVSIRFSFPLRYLEHFPQHMGAELRIRLHPVRVPVSDLHAAHKREAVVPRYAESAAVDEVIYEGDIEGGPYLTVRFVRPVAYQVIPGSDYRSMNVTVRSLD